MAGRSQLLSHAKWRSPVITPAQTIFFVTTWNARHSDDVVLLFWSRVTFQKLDGRSISASLASELATFGGQFLPKQFFFVTTCNTRRSDNVVLLFWSRFTFQKLDGGSISTSLSYRLTRSPILQMVPRNLRRLSRPPQQRSTRRLRSLLATS